MSEPSDIQPGDLVAALRRLTPARIGLGRSGAGLATAEVLRFSLAHAQARDAVHACFDAEAIARGLRELGLDPLIADSAAPSRDVYLRRPDLGRRLAAESREALSRLAAPASDLVLVLADGLSARAVHDHALPFAEALLSKLAEAGVALGRAVVAREARVALGDEVGALLKARSVAVLIGERPGLSSPDSLGLYLTFDPRPGRTDAERNCISNIRTEGLPYRAAAHKAAWLIREALRRGLTGVELKDESGPALGGAPAQAALGAGEPG
ncbi:ethanolamine ammonia-lyase [Alsobacter soli]|uniref:Ethanolamine ammonia-lyase small subunit n=1 Tax=Alsobacter soli TaxID=2109933 RepID=A0A2T1HWC3_9HYPH|nr:ethanolamine ammonia-lyase subunit EutC [Alsobacter soli]PSC05895.1 ethanolamine ammonia-lyase [Alsobacter soli]